jgi:hypothetical protein
LKSAADKYKYDFREMFKDYCDFKKQYSDRLQEDFNKIVANKTNLRGLKVRGVYETLEAAQQRARQLRETDEYFNVFVGEVGYWIPFDPDPQLIQDQEYMEGELNNLVKENIKNQALAKKYFEKRKNDMIEEALKEGRDITENDIRDALNREVQEIGDNVKTPEEGKYNGIFEKNVDVSKISNE